MDARRLKLIAFKMFCLPFLMLICCTVIAKGLRFMYADFTWKLYRLPCLGFLQRWQGWHRLDMANLLAVALILLEYFVLVTAIRYLLVPSMMEETATWSAKNDRSLTWTGFVVLLVGEATLFFLGVMTNDNEWEGGGSAPVAVVGALLYTMAIVFVAYVTVRLERRS